MKFAGKVRLPCARLTGNRPRSAAEGIVTILPAGSNGWRSTSSPPKVAKLRQLVQEQHASMREADLPRPRPLPAAHETRVRTGVVRRARRPVADQRRVRWHAARSPPPSKCASRPAPPQATCAAHRRCRRHRTGQQRLARARRATHQYIISTRRRHFQRSLDVLLTLDAYTIVPVTRLLSSDPGVTVRSSGRQGERPGEYAWMCHRILADAMRLCC
jgi:hypothetical protein